MPLPLPVDRAAYHRLRWRARIWTVVLAIPAVEGIVVIAELATSPAAALPFFLVGIYLAIAGTVLTKLWLASYRARPAVLSLDASPGVAMGVPELDEPNAVRHLGLSGEAEPPTRW